MGDSEQLPSRETDSQSLDSDTKNFSHGEEFISDGVNLIGQGPDFMRSAPTDYG